MGQTLWVPADQSGPAHLLGFLGFLALVQTACQDYEFDGPPEDSSLDVCDIVTSRWLGDEQPFAIPAPGYNPAPTDCNATKCIMWSTDLRPVLEIVQGDERDSFDSTIGGGQPNLGNDGIDEPNWGGFSTFDGQICYGDLVDCDANTPGIQGCNGACFAANSLDYSSTILGNYEFDPTNYPGLFLSFGYILSDGNGNKMRGFFGEESPGSWDDALDGEWGGNYPNTFSYIYEYPTAPPTTFTGDMTYDGTSTYAADSTLLSLVENELGWADTCSGGSKSNSSGDFAAQTSSSTSSVSFTALSGTGEKASSLPTGSVDSYGWVYWTVDDSALSEATVGLPRPGGRLKGSYRDFTPQSPTTTGSAWVHMTLEIDDGDVNGSINWTGYLRVGSIQHEDFAFTVVGDAVIINPEASPGQWIIVATLRTPSTTGNPNIDNLRVKVTMFNATNRILVQKGALGAADPPEDMLWTNEPSAGLISTSTIRILNGYYE